MPEANFNIVRRSMHRYTVTSDNVLTCTRGSILSMKMARQNTAATAKIVPLFSAVRLSKIVGYNTLLLQDTSSATKTPRFKWLTENSNGIDTKFSTGTAQLSKTVLIPSGRARLWSNTLSEEDTLFEPLFEIKDCEGMIFDVYFEYVETSGLPVTYSSTGMDLVSMGTTYLPLDCFAVGAHTVGSWNIIPLVDDTQALSETKPTTFTR
jgi:hypothetical protein